MLVSKEDYIKEYFNLHRLRYLQNDLWSVMRIANVMHLVQPQPDDIILDIGSGIGTVAIEAAKRKAKVVSTDYSICALKIQRSLTQYILLTQPRLICSNALKLPFKKEIFTKVTAVDFFEHIYMGDLPIVLKEVYRILKLGGELIIYTPNPPESIKPDFLAKLLRKVGTSFSEPFRKILKFLLQLQEYYLKIDKIKLHDEKFDYLHVDLKSPEVLRKSLLKARFKIAKIKAFNTSSIFSKILPYPYNCIFGGHIGIKAKKA